MKARWCVYVTVMLWLLAAWLVPMALGMMSLPRHASLAREVATEHFWIACPAMLLACAVLWMRHRRAFRYVEISKTHWPHS